MKMSDRLKIGGIVLVVGLVVVVVLVLAYGMGKNDYQNYQIIQTVGGEVEVRDRPGWYPKLAATVWTYPKSVQRYFSSSTDEGGSADESIRATFNDGGTASVSTMIRFRMPIDKEMRKKIHQDFSGNVTNVVEAVRSHMINCVKATAPLMSGSEHQSARKSEFTQLVEQQLRVGLYEMRKVEKELKDRTDTNGKPITVFATEIVNDVKGMPVISQSSPLNEYGIEVTQFSVTGTKYDEQTLAQFEAKKSAYLAAEKSKAEREQEVQQRLMIEERGLREKAEVEAKANKEKAAFVIQAQREKQVAELEAEKKLAVAKLDKQEAETRAQKELEVAKLDRQAAEETAQKIRVLASAEEERINKAGAVTEKERVTLEIAAKRDAMVAAELSKINVPQYIISGGNGGGGVMENLINLNLLKNFGIVNSNVEVDSVPVSK